MTEHDEALEEYRREILETQRPIEITTKGILAFEEGLVRILVRSPGGVQELKVNELELQALVEAAGRHRLNKILESKPTAAELREKVRLAEQRVEDEAGIASHAVLIDAMADETTAWQAYAKALESILVENRDAEEAARIAGVAEEARREKRNNTRAHGEAIGDALRACGIGVQYALAGPVELWDVANQLEKRGYGVEMPAYSVPVARSVLRSAMKALEAHGEQERAEKIREALAVPAREQQGIPVPLNTLTYAATALESSADNGDRYAARQIREAVVAALGRETQQTGVYEEFTEIVKAEACMKAGTHKPVQHRDGKPPWCKECGLTAAGTVPMSKIGGKS